MRNLNLTWTETHSRILFNERRRGSILLCWLEKVKNQKRVHIQIDAVLHFLSSLHPPESQVAKVLRLRVNENEIRKNGKNINQCEHKTNGVLTGSEVHSVGHFVSAYGLCTGQTRATGLRPVCCSHGRCSLFVRFRKFHLKMTVARFIISLVLNSVSAIICPDIVANRT